MRRSRRIKVDIPAGIDDGQTISLRGLGNAGRNGGPAGDLLVTVSVRSHPQFEREGTSILYELPVSIVQASLGAEVEVPTIDGKVKYTVPRARSPERCSVCAARACRISTAAAAATSSSRCASSRRRI